MRQKRISIYLSPTLDNYWSNSVKQVVTGKRMNKDLRSLCAFCLRPECDEKTHKMIKKGFLPTGPHKNDQTLFFLRGKEHKHGGKNAAALKTDARVLWSLLSEALRIEGSKQLCAQPRSADQPREIQRSATKVSHMYNFNFCSNCTEKRNR